MLRMIFPSWATIPPSSRRFAGFSVRTNDWPAPRVNSLKFEIHGSDDLILSIVQSPSSTSTLPKFVIST
ncbi:MAG: hypothetical protein CXT72_06515 [Methanobacteriota archaeon]|nr:MAG: hypothetical protein CXT72_06515 [Euryarchaeota archaeon]